MKNFDWKSMVPHAVAVLVFLVLTLVYFSPVLEGKDIMQDDAIGSMAWGKDAKDYHEESGEYSYWSNSMFSGMPCNYTYSPQPAMYISRWAMCLPLMSSGLRAVTSDVSLPHSLAVIYCSLHWAASLGSVLPVR